MKRESGKIFKYGKEFGRIPVSENKTKAKQGKRRGLYQQMEVALEAVLEPVEPVEETRQAFTDAARAMSQLAHSAIPAPVVHEVSKTVSDGLMRSAFARSVPILQLR